ncbi:MAG: transglycosylase SLT domain-containing protein [Paracoccaceae bacterium]|nr:transglycosylase SLT domain-containing protein [Paracoccaceae bacterium]
MLRASIILSGLVVTLGGGTALRSTTPETVCLQSAARAAKRTGVPFATLATIALAESGRRVGKHFNPWPWTLNIAGRGAWFATRAEARRAAEAELAEGRDAFDVGCFQINAHWHGAQFPSVDAMLDPQTNALYAAQFLLSLYRQTGDWSLAAGAYHSQDPDEAAIYRARLSGIRAPAPPAAAKGPAPGPLIARDTTQPLLMPPMTQMAQDPMLGSLFPLPDKADLPPLIGGNG